MLQPLTRMSTMQRHGERTQSNHSNMQDSDRLFLMDIHSRKRQTEASFAADSFLGKTNKTPLKLIGPGKP